MVKGSKANGRVVSIEIGKSRIRLDLEGGVRKLNYLSTAEGDRGKKKKIGNAISFGGQASGRGKIGSGGIPKKLFGNRAKRRKDVGRQLRIGERTLVTDRHL